MRSDLYQELYDLEKDYWWHVGKRQIAFSLIRQFSRSFDTALDIGCGAGLVVEELGQLYKKAIGLDVSPEAIGFCQKRGLNNLVLSGAEKIELPDGTIDTITAFDVLEHVDDQQTLAECTRLLKPGGILVATVPAYPKLWSYWDEMLGHKRRYSKKSLTNVLIDAGFTIHKISYSNFFILGPVTLIRLLKKSNVTAKKQSDFIPTPTLLNSFLKRLYTLESVIIKNIGFPAGLSLVVVAEKK